MCFLNRRLNGCSDPSARAPDKCALANESSSRRSGSGFAALACALLALVFTACSGGDTREAANEARESVLGVIDATLAQLDPLSLRPIGPRATLRDYVASSGRYSPDGSRLVLAENGSSLRLRFVSATTLRTRGTLSLGVHGRTLLAIAWPRQRRLLVALTSSPRSRELVVGVVDPETGQVAIQRLAAAGMPVRIDSGRWGIALLLAPRDAISPARLVTITPQGRIRSVVLDQIPAGNEASQAGTHGPLQLQLPALTVDAERQRAFVVSGAGPVAEVDLLTLRTSYHPLQRRASALGRVLGWLDPPAYASHNLEGPVRFATWIGNHLIAVSGWNGRGVDGRAPSGLTLIDTRSWSERVMTGQASNVAVARGIILAYESSEATDSTGMGMAAYSLDGDLLWHTLDSRRIENVQVIGSRALVWVADSSATVLGQPVSISVIDLRTGSIVRSLRRSWPEVISRY